MKPLLYSLILLVAPAFGQTAQIWPPWTAAMPTEQLQWRYDRLQHEIELTYDWSRLVALVAEQKPIEDELTRRDMAQLRANTEALQAGVGKQRKP